MVWVLAEAAASLSAAIARAEHRDTAPPVTRVAADPANSLPLHVEQIVFRGNRALPLSALQTIAAPYVGRDLSAADMEELRSALTRRYTDHGYVNSGVVLDPDEPFHDGVLTFRAIEGHIREIRVHGLGGLRSSYVIDRLRGPDDEVLNTDVLRARFQRLSDDPLFAHVSSRVEPLANSADALLDVDVQRGRPYSFTLALNDYRPPEIGEKGYDLSGQVRDLTGDGDVADVNLTGPLESSGGLGFGLSWQVPVGPYGTSATVSAARINTVFTEQPLTTQDVRSTIERQELKLGQLLWSSLRQQVNLSASVARERESTVSNDLFGSLGGSAAEATHSLTERLIPEYTYRTAQHYLSVTFTLLHAHLLEEEGPPADLPPKQNYFLGMGQFHDVWPLAPAPFELETRATVQRTDARISDLHALAIGGINSVRGFRENEFLASNGSNLNVDLRWIALPAATSARPGLSLGIFFDWAAGHDVGEHTDTFSSCGSTLRLKWPRVQADFAYGLPLVHPAFVSAEHGSWQDRGIHVQIATML
jgi:hemolysin activation/secretion protein